MSDIPHVQIDEIERNLGFVVAREPEAAIAFDGDPEDIYDGDVRAVVLAARQLVAVDIPATVENISAKTGLPVATLRVWSDSCTRDMRRNWKTYAKLIKLDAVRRRLQDFSHDLHKAASTMTDLFGVEQMLKDAQTELMLLDNNRKNELLDVGEIIDVYAARPEMRVPPLATQFHDLNRVTKGGLGRKRMWVLTGPQKRGKTTFMRCVLLYLARSGHRVAHVAHDGGDKYDHALAYWSILAHQYAIETRAPVNAVVKDTGEQIFFLTDEYMNAYATGVVDFDKLHVDKRTIECIDRARAELKRLTSMNETGGALMLIDASDVNGDLYELIRMLDRILITRGLDCFAIDHVGQLDNKMRNELEKMTENVRQIARFKNNRGLPCILIAQQTREGTDGEESYSAKLRNLTTLEHECDTLMIVQGDHSMPDMTKVFVKFNRVGPGGVEFFLKRYAESGLVTER